MDKHSFYHWNKFKLAHIWWEEFYHYNGVLKLKKVMKRHHNHVRKHSSLLINQYNNPFDFSK